MTSWILSGFNRAIAVHVNGPFTALSSTGESSREQQRGGPVKVGRRPPVGEPLPRPGCTNTKSSFESAGGAKRWRDPSIVRLVHSPVWVKVRGQSKCAGRASLDETGQRRWCLVAPPGVLTPTSVEGGAIAVPPQGLLCAQDSLDSASRTGTATNPFYGYRRPTKSNPVLVEIADLKRIGFLHN